MAEHNQPAVRESNGGVPPISVREVKAQTEAIHQLFEDVLRDDTHYGVIPGTPKPTLYKAGAEKIGLLLHLAPSFKRQMDWSDGHLTVISECTLAHQATGTVIASAGAMCTTRETKYAYRQATRKCPLCGKATIIKGKKEFGGGWLCFAKKGGCGEKWPDGATEIESQSEEREENPNLPDTYNTVMKMADKRAYVAATLFGTAASDIFTQDVEDFGVYEDEGVSRKTEPASTGLPRAEFQFVNDPPPSPAPETGDIAGPRSEGDSPQASPSPPPAVVPRGGRPSGEATRLRDLIQEAVSKEQVSAVYRENQERWDKLTEREKEWLEKTAVKREEQLEAQEGVA